MDGWMGNSPIPIPVPVLGEVAIFQAQNTETNNSASRHIMENCMCLTQTFKHKVSQFCQVCHVGYRCIYMSPSSLVSDPIQIMVSVHPQ